MTTEILALDGSGGAERYADSSQWRKARRKSATPAKRKAASPRVTTPSPGPRRLSYLEQREWEGIQEAIVAAEARLEEARQRTGDPSIATDADALQECALALDEAQREIDRLYERWAELEAKKS